MKRSVLSLTLVLLCTALVAGQEATPTPPAQGPPAEIQVPVAATPTPVPADIRQTLGEARGKIQAIQEDIAALQSRLKVAAYDLDALIRQTTPPGMMLDLEHWTYVPAPPPPERPAAPKK